MRLIKEVTENLDYLIEESNDGKKNLYITGPFLQTEKLNRNGRKYLHEVMAKEVQRYTENYINKNRAFGELGHPDTPSINLDRVSHLIVGLRQEGNDWMLVNGVWTEMDHDYAKQAIRKASRKEIEAVSLQIFENFIKKL
jgi:hypothetical protein